MTWENNPVDLGTIKQNTPKTVYFNATEMDKVVKSVKAGCSCSSAEWEAENNRIKVVYKGASWPKHLKDKSVVKIQKMITVQYEDDTSENLSFIAKLEK
jgi:hypothetical protein